jgi:N-acetyl-alpha-D-muramate 1-phosphate uridylyltransferase
VLTRALVFAAGLGTRMRPLTLHTPKALVPVAGKPLLAYALEHFEAAQCSRIVVNSHHLAEQVAAYLKQRPSRAELVRSHEEQLLETGGAVLKALPLLGEAPFFTANSDAIWLDREISALARMRSSYDPERMDALLLLQPLSRVINGAGSADFGLNELGELTRDGDRPYVYTGISVLHPRLLTDRAIRRFSLVDAWFAARRPDGSLARVFGLVHDGDWMPVGTPQELASAEAFLAGRARPPSA